MADRHRIVLVGGIPVDTFVALSRLLPPGSVVVSDHQEGPDRIVIEWSTSPRGGRVRFTVRYPYEITDQERRRRQRARQGLWTSVSVEVELGTDEVWGDNIFTAMETWERRLAGVLEQSPLPGVACRHCSGTGFLRGGGTDG